MFLSFDRPEDRPNTLLWLSTQLIAGYLILIPIIIYFYKIGYGALILVPILVNGIGDGLAEPVGVRFGRLKYKTYALFTKIKYERTIEGSACVFFTSIILIIFLVCFSFQINCCNPSNSRTSNVFCVEIKEIVFNTILMKEIVQI